MGGNIFDNTKPIKKEHIYPTINSFLSELSILFPNFNFKPVDFFKLGSTGKKEISFDIDLGIDISFFDELKEPENMAKIFNIPLADVNKKFNTFKKRAKTSTDEQLKLKLFLFLLRDYIGEHSNVIYCGNKMPTTNSIYFSLPQFDKNYLCLGQMVQIDVNIGNPEWLKFAYYSSKISKDMFTVGLHRTQLLIALFNIADLTFSHTNGIKEKNSNSWIINTPKEALELINKKLNISLTLEMCYDFDTLLTYIYVNLNEEHFDKLIDVYLKILDSTRCHIPHFFVDEWLKKQEKLNLTGKFLPDDSPLKTEESRLKLKQLLREIDML